MYKAKNDNSEPRIHLTRNSEFSGSSKLSLWPNPDIWNFHSSLTMNGKLIGYFSSPLYATVSNITHFLIPFGMREKNDLV